MHEGNDPGATCRRSPAVALVRMAAAPFEQRTGAPVQPANVAATRTPASVERTVTLRRGGFGQLGDSVSLDDVV